MSQFPSSSSSPRKSIEVRKETRLLPFNFLIFSVFRADVIVPIDLRHETPSRDVEMQEQGQEDGTTPPVLSPFPSAEGDHDQPSEEGAVDAHGGPNGVNGHVVKEEDSKMEGVEDAKDEAGPSSLPPTSPTPGVEDGSQGTDADAGEHNAHLAPEDQPHPAKRARKHSDADAASVISVRGFCRIMRFVLCRFGRADQLRRVYQEPISTPCSRSRPDFERYNRPPSHEPHPNAHSTPGVQLPWNSFTNASPTQVLPIDPQESEEIERCAAVHVPR